MVGVHIDSLTWSASDRGASATIKMISYFPCTALSFSSCLCIITEMLCSRDDQRRIEAVALLASVGKDDGRSEVVGPGTCPDNTKLKGFPLVHPLPWVVRKGKRLYGESPFPLVLICLM